MPHAPRNQTKTLTAVRCSVSFDDVTLIVSNLLRPQSPSSQRRPAMSLQVAILTAQQPEATKRNPRQAASKIRVRHQRLSAGRPACRRRRTIEVSDGDEPPLTLQLPLG